MLLKSTSAIVVIAALSTSLAQRATAEAEAGKWISISDTVIVQLTKENKKIGYPGLTGGVGVDRVTGDVYMVVCDQGLWKSSDQGQTFARVDDGNVTGRCETGFEFDFDPAGKRLACFTVYGNSALSSDAGKSWRRSTAGHNDFVSVDWSSDSLVTLKHESGGVLIKSDDGGKTWATLGKGFFNVGLLDAKTLVATKEGKASSIIRSTDGGQTWSEVSNLKPVGRAPRITSGAVYWVGDQGLLVSRDKGASWAQLGKPVKAMLGPYFGKDEKQIVVVGKEGVMETTDSGETWKKAAPLPPGVEGDGMSQFGWDPTHNVFYAGKMGKSTFKYQR